jgi:hypothetical protein
MNRDYSNADIRKTYDDFHSHAPLTAGRLIERARRHAPGANSICHRRLALEYLGGENATLLCSLLKGRNLRRPEPSRTSPTEQMKGMTGSLNTFGEITGGNFGAGF